MFEFFTFLNRASTEYAKRPIYEKPNKSSINVINQISITENIQKIQTERQVLKFNSNKPPAIIFIGFIVPSMKIINDFLFFND